MSLVPVDGFNLKIQSFLQNAGVNYDDNKCSQTQLLRYFEEEYGLHMMHLLEQEWIDEQLERDLTSGDFKHLRKFVAEDQLNSYDEAVSSLWEA
ncbi:MAG: hypothetical protein BMS9Abin05_2100 [Rhodothermia bacterium]|nr:MAG: hypothetical protein BMS9Abin05_2100 [Rhodothermia bacterium]